MYIFKPLLYFGLFLVSFEKSQESKVVKRKEDDFYYFLNLLMNIEFW